VLNKWLSVSIRWTTKPLTIVKKDLMKLNKNYQLI